MVKSFFTPLRRVRGLELKLQAFLTSALSSSANQVSFFDKTQIFIIMFIEFVHLCYLEPHECTRHFSTFFLKYPVEYYPTIHGMGRTLKFSKNSSVLVNKPFTNKWKQNYFCCHKNSIWWIRNYKPPHNVPFQVRNMSGLKQKGSLDDRLLHCLITPGKDHLTQIE